MIINNLLSIIMVSPFQRHAKVFQDKRFNDAYNAYMGIGKKNKKKK